MGARAVQAANFFGDNWYATERPYRTPLFQARSMLGMHLIR